MKRVLVTVPFNEKQLKELQSAGNDPLHHIPGLLLTPHITGGFHLQKTVDNIFDICMNNLKA